MDQTRIFGPVPSRRLGKSIGINNIPPKICTYSCVYCQLGKSLKMITERCVDKKIWKKRSNLLANSIVCWPTINFLFQPIIMNDFI